MLRAWWKIRKATRAMEKCARSFKVDISNLKRGNYDPGDLADLRNDEAQYVGEHWLVRQAVITEHLVAQARRLNVPLPDDGDKTMWISHPDVIDERALSAKGVSELRKAIREERQARGIYPKIVFTAIASFIAAIGAVVTILKTLIKISGGSN